MNRISMVHGTQIGGESAVNAANVLALLRRIEWVYPPYPCGEVNYEFEWCPCCRARAPAHLLDCQLADLIRILRKEHP